MTRKLLILDLDETLIYATERPLAHKADFRAGIYHVYKRPHVDTFLEACLERFEVAVWTSSSSYYATAVLQQLFSDVQRLSFIWTGERCTWKTDFETGEQVSRKNLVKVKRKGYRLESVLVVDDSPEKYHSHYGNLIRVTEFRGHTDDGELLLLLSYLDTLMDVENVRSLEKRGWRKRVEPHDPF